MSCHIINSTICLKLIQSSAAWISLPSNLFDLFVAWSSGHSVLRYASSSKALTWATFLQVSSCQHIHGQRIGQSLVVYGVDMPVSYLFLKQFPISVLDLLKIWGLKTNKYNLSCERFKQYQYFGYWLIIFCTVTKSDKNKKCIIVLINQSVSW